MLAGGARVQRRHFPRDRKSSHGQLLFQPCRLRRVFSQLDGRSGDGGISNALAQVISGGCGIWKRLRSGWTHPLGIRPERRALGRRAAHPSARVRTARGTRETASCTCRSRTARYRHRGDRKRNTLVRRVVRARPDSGGAAGIPAGWHRIVFRMLEDCWATSSSSGRRTPPAGCGAGSGRPNSALRGRARVDPVRITGVRAASRVRASGSAARQPPAESSSSMMRSPSSPRASGRRCRCPAAAMPARAARIGASSNDSTTRDVRFGHLDRRTRQFDCDMCMRLFAPSLAVRPWPTG